ncbi:MAG: hypothetical protein AVDCRST_MAG79-1727, partial [uncultured Thermoleophilia bacterium]
GGRVPGPVQLARRIGVRGWDHHRRRHQGRNDHGEGRPERHPRHRRPVPPGPRRAATARRSRNGRPGRTHGRDG